MSTVFRFHIRFLRSRHGKSPQAARALPAGF
jgi:hypothetical protein